MREMHSPHVHMRRINLDAKAISTAVTTDFSCPSQFAARVRPALFRAEAVISDDPTQRRRIGAWLTYRGDENAFPASEPSHHFVTPASAAPRAAGSTRTKPQRKAGSAVRDQRSSREAVAVGAELPRRQSPRTGIKRRAQGGEEPSHIRQIPAAAGERRTCRQRMSWPGE